MKILIMVMIFISSVYAENKGYNYLVHYSVYQGPLSIYSMVVPTITYIVEKSTFVNNSSLKSEEEWVYFEDCDCKKLVIKSK